MERRIWAGTRALAQQHLDAGQRVFLVTATPVELARIIAARLGLTGALGTVSEVEDGLLHRPPGRRAPARPGQGARPCARSPSARGSTCRRCTAYSDTINDVPMLSAVGHAVAVNPDAALREQARARGWDVRDFRTGRKAAKIGVPAAAGVGAVAGGVVGGSRCTAGAPGAATSAGWPRRCARCGCPPRRPATCCARSGCRPPPPVGPPASAPPARPRPGGRRGPRPGDANVAAAGASKRPCGRAPRRRRCGAA